MSYYFESELFQTTLIWHGVKFVFRGVHHRDDALDQLERFKNGEEYTLVQADSMLNLWIFNKQGFEDETF